MEAGETSKRVIHAKGGRSRGAVGTDGNGREKEKDRDEIRRKRKKRVGGGERESGGALSTFSNDAITLPLRLKAK